jgi:hypothetical protein
MTRLHIIGMFSELYRKVWALDDDGHPWCGTPPPLDGRTICQTYLTGYKWRRAAPSKAPRSLQWNLERMAGTEHVLDLDDDGNPVTKSTTTATTSERSD